MPNIKPVSDLRNYNEVLRDCSDGEPVFLTKNGRGKYVLIDIHEYQKQQAVLNLLTKLSAAESETKTNNKWLTLEDLKSELKV